MHVSVDGGGNPVNKSDYDWPTNIGQDELIKEIHLYFS